MKEALYKLQQDFDKLALSHDELIAKSQLIEEQNQRIKNQIESTQSFISQQVLQQALAKPLNKNFQFGTSLFSFSKQYCSFEDSNAQSINSELLIKVNKEKQDEQSILQNQSIIELQNQVKSLKKRIFFMENEVHIKQSQLKFSELYFRQKLQIYANEAISRSYRQFTSPQIQFHQALKKDLLRFNSVQSIQSIETSQASQQYSFNNEDSDIFDVVNQYSCRRKFGQRSLMQDLVQDIQLPIQRNKCLSLIDSEMNFPDSSCVFQQNKNTSVSATNIEYMESKGVQTNSYLINKTINKQITPSKPTIKELNNPFIGFNLIMSLFTKQKTQKPPVLKSKNQNSFFGENSLSEIFKEVFQYATKKIVTNRIHKKKKNQIKNFFVSKC